MGAKIWHVKIYRWQKACLFICQCVIQIAQADFNPLDLNRVGTAFSSSLFPSLFDEAKPVMLLCEGVEQLLDPRQLKIYRKYLEKFNFCVHPAEFCGVLAMKVEYFEVLSFLEDNTSFSICQNLGADTLKWLEHLYADKLSQDFRAKSIKISNYIISVGRLQKVYIALEETDTTSYYEGTIFSCFGFFLVMNTIHILYHDLLNSAGCIELPFMCLFRKCVFLRSTRG